MKDFGWWKSLVPNVTNRRRTCISCGKTYFFYKKDIDTKKEKYCSKCIKLGKK